VIFRGLTLSASTRLILPTIKQQMGGQSTDVVEEGFSEVLAFADCDGVVHWLINDI
jgi:hypothetical protein